MRAGVDFNRVLDDKLGHSTFAWSSSVPDETTYPRGTARPVFLFGDVSSGFTAGPQPAPKPRPRMSSSASPWTAVYAARPEAQPRPVRTLTAGEKAALDVLRSLGCVTLVNDFTDAELKTAFRFLALRFHPDRHPGSTDEERAELARTFARIAEAYRTLTRVN
jgi:hypothetical protein